MHIGEIITADTANGQGFRLSIFVSGCTNHCKGCFQPETWDFHYGKKYTEEMEEFILNELKRPFYQGLTILGGEPFEPENQKALLPLIQKVKDRCPDRDLWMYTGFVYDKDLVEGGRRYVADVTDKILKCVDVLVDGPFIEEKKNLSLPYRGSENQRIINMKETLKEGVVTPLQIG